MTRLTRRSDVLRVGFTDVDAASDALARLGEGAQPLLRHFDGVADPDLALAGLVRLAEAVGDRDDFLARLDEEEQTARRVLAVLGASTALTDHLVTHPHHWEDLSRPHLARTRTPAFVMRASLLEAVGADPDAALPVAAGEDDAAVDALKVDYRRQLLLLAARDLAHGVRIDDVAAELADLAAGTLEAALAIARQRVGEEADTVRLAVIGMGKCGGHELNYLSDVDVVFVHEPADGVEEEQAARTASKLASHLMRICSTPTREGSIWEVDAALRPEGKAGPLSRTLGSHERYYERWAEPWEFQAMLKARPVAGDRDLGDRFIAMIDPLVWTVAERDGFVEAARAMRRRVVDHIPAKTVARELKLGEGGLRDVEFAVQLLQLVHGRVDERIRQPTTLSALHALTQHGYVGRQDGETLHAAYAFLRSLEHRIQLHRMRRSHVVPEDPRVLRLLGRSLGFTAQPAEAVERAWEHHRNEVVRLHQKIFYRPLLDAVARIAGDEVRLSSDAAADRLRALGYDDPAAALRNLDALTTGVSRTATIQRALLPAMLQWFAEGANPDAGLFGFRRISETLGRTPWYLKTLRDEGQVAQRLATLLATSRYCTDLLEREPAGVRLLSGDLQPRRGEDVVGEMLATGRRQEDPNDAVRSVRAVRRRELLRTAAGDVLGLTDVAEVERGLTSLTDATLEAALSVVEEAVRREKGLDRAPTRFAIIAMGRYGGFELSYGSDADVMFVHDPEEGVEPEQAAAFAQALANELRRTLGAPGSDPPLEIDPDLRPEGRQGPLVRTLDSYAGYYAQWSEVWEAQALLRADAVVGDETLRRRFIEMIDPLRYPEGGLSEKDVIEVRRIKARVDKERMPRGVDPTMHLKLGRGALADIEWTIQLLQLRHGAEVAGLRTTRTLAALEAAREADLVSADDAAVLAEAWRMASRLRNAVTLARGKSADHVPRDATERRAVAQIMGFSSLETDAMINEYLRATRRAHRVVDHLFW